MSNESITIKNTAINYPNWYSNSCPHKLPCGYCMIMRSLCIKPEITCTSTSTGTDTITAKL